MLLVLGAILPLTSGCSAVPTGESEEPIKIGAALPLTGPYAADGLGYDQGIMFAVDEINAEGGLLGRPVEVLHFDTMDIAPERVVSAADQLVGGDHVDAAFGGWSGWGGDVTAFGKYDAPFFHYDASLSAIEVFREDPVQYSNIFMVTDVEGPHGQVQFDNMASLPYEYPSKTIALIAADDAWGRGVIGGIKEGAAGDEDWEVVMEEIVPYGTREWGPILTKLRTLSPGWVHIEIVSPADVATFLHQFMSNPTNTLINCGYSMSPPEFMELMGEDANGVTGQGGSFLGFPPSTPGEKEWVDAFISKYGNDPSAGSPAFYGVVKLWAEAVRQVGDPTDHAAICEWIATHPYEIIPGTTVMFDEDNKWPMAGVEYPYKMSWVQVQDDKFVTIRSQRDQFVDYEGIEHHFETPPWIK